MKKIYLLMCCVFYISTFAFSQSLDKMFQYNGLQVNYPSSYSVKNKKTDKLTSFQLSTTEPSGDFSLVMFSYGKNVLSDNQGTLSQACSLRLNALKPKKDNPTMKNANLYKNYVDDYTDYAIGISGYSCVVEGIPTYQIILVAISNENIMIAIGQTSSWENLSTLKDILKTVQYPIISSLDINHVCQQYDLLAPDLSQKFTYGGLIIGYPQGFEIVDPKSERLHSFTLQKQNIKNDEICMMHLTYGNDNFASNLSMDQECLRRLNAMIDTYKSKPDYKKIKVNEPYVETIGNYSVGAVDLSFSYSGSTKYVCISLLYSPNYLRLAICITTKMEYMEQLIPVVGSAQIPNEFGYRVGDLSSVYSNLREWKQSAEKVAQEIQDAQAGISSAQVNLGLRYFKGDGVETNPSLGFSWLQKAANEGNISAYIYLATCYKSGSGVTKDMEKAFYWYQRSMETGNTAAKELGKFYEEGIVVDKDLKKAESLYLMNARYDWGSQASLGLLYKKIEDYDNAVYWLNKAINNKYCQNTEKLKQDLIECSGDRVQVNDIWYHILPNGKARVGQQDTPSSCPNNIIIPSTITVNGTSYPVIQLEKKAFANCTRLKTITLPASITEIGDDAFYGCSSLMSINMQNGISKIGDDAFRECSNLYSIDIPNSVQHIGKRAFQSSGLKMFPSLGNEKVIRYGCFRNCENLTSVIIPEGVDSIIMWSFGGCNNLKEITIPYSAKHMGLRTFVDCKKLQSCIILSEEMHIDSEDVFAGCDVPLVKVPFGKKEYYKMAIQSHDVDIEEMSNNDKKAHIQLIQGSIEFLETNPNKAIDANENCQIKFQVYNDGNKESSRYRIIADGQGETEGIIFSEIEVLPIAPGETKTISVPITSNIYTKDGNIAIRIRLLDHGVQVMEPISYALATKAPMINDKNHPSIEIGSLGSDVDKNIPTTNQPCPNTFVVIIANENYMQVASVPYALNDGKVFQDYCVKTLGVPQKNIHYVANATLNQIKAAVNWLEAITNVFENTHIIFYYAGHGIPDEMSQSAYLLPIDGSGSDITTGYKLDDLYASLGNMPTNHITVFMDACFSGSQRGSGMLASARGVALKSKAGIPQGNMVVFSAAQGDETAYPNNEQGHGMFTYYLLKKLQETGGNVNLQVLSQYIIKNVSQQSILLNGKSQTPTVTASKLLGETWYEWNLK